MSLLYICRITRWRILDVSFQTKLKYFTWMCADGKTFKKPRRPFEKERLDAELKTVGEFGLRNKRELWRVQAALSKIRKAARTLLTLDDKVHPACRTTNLPEEIVQGQMLG